MVTSNPQRKKSLGGTFRVLFLACLSVSAIAMVVKFAQPREAMTEGRLIVAISLFVTLATTILAGLFLILAGKKEWSNSRALAWLVLLAFPFWLIPSLASFFTSD